MPLIIAENFFNNNSNSNNKKRDRLLDDLVNDLHAF